MNGAGADLVLEAEAGVVVPAEDGPALAEAILALRNLPEQERAAMGANGRLYYETNFSHEKLVDELIGHFDRSVRLYRGEIS